MSKVIQRKWYTITNLAPDEGKSNETDPALIRMSGIVGLEIDDIIFAEDLDFLGAERALDVEINTPGGIVDVGVAIYNLLKKHKGPVSTRTNGQAASAGTLIFLGGDKDKRIVETGATLMVHNPGRPFAFETLEAKELRAAASQLDVVREAIIDIYQEATGIDRDTIGVLMDDLGKAMSQGRGDLCMLGGGNPGYIPEIVRSRWR